MTASPERFDAIVIGSGFGGAVTAYRLAEAGKRVCVLERGRAYPPGSFARTPSQMRTNFWDPTKGLYGLFDLWSFHGLNALVSSGLGGGSLIYANVLLRKDERWFVTEDLDNGGFEHWPVTRDDLDPHYDRVEAMIRPQLYPLEHEPYASTPKTQEFRRATEAIGLAWFRPPLAVAFASDGDDPVPGERVHEAHPNLHGRSRHTCRLCGECDIGCNYGSKSSLDFNYLTEAKRLGAELWTRCEVRKLAPEPGGGYRVNYVRYDEADEREGRPTDIFDPEVFRHELVADRVILAGGTLGTVRLLLRNRAAFPLMSDQLGNRFCGNGDLLTFAHGASHTDGTTRRQRRIDPSFGPVITSAARVPDELDGGEGRGLYVEDAGFPAIATWLLQLAEGPGDLWRWRREAFRFARERMRPGYRHTGRSAAFAGLMGTAQLSSSLLPLLSMGRDVADGRMYLRDNHLQVDWRKGSAKRAGRRGRSGPYFDRARGISKQIADELGATLRDNPIWFMRRVITVHPLGGCSMATDPRHGVVDPWGRVFGYPGLYVADGSVMPGPVGANPSLTIAALADRFADGILAEKAS
ncbi:FAD-dependent oxidoreductase [Desertimonas flava]|uniref:FAD-dependent oxidoreductase n=1 Tax=Desertimonas flava TaxID=2064846 RepID=UPI000E34F4C3|nr:GMC family oxidoreductase [Desertimonas flava]